MYTNILLQRTFQFSVAVAKAMQLLQHDIINKVFIHQLMKASSSVGANYRATQWAKSTNDFLNKLKIVEKEADECNFCIELLKVLNPAHAPLLQPHKQEATEILKMIVTAITKVRQQKK